MNFYYDSGGMIHYFDIQDIMDDVMSRQSRTASGAGGGRRRRRRRRHPRLPMIYQAPNPMFNHHAPMPYPAPSPAAQPVPVRTAQDGQGLDMRGALDALGALLPAAGKMIAAFRHPPDRPRLTGQPEKDLPEILDYMAENFAHARSGAQTSGVLATAGAVMEILASL